MLLEALTTGDESVPVLPVHSSQSPVRDADKGRERGRDKEKESDVERGREMSASALDAIPIIDSSNFIFDSFLRRHEHDMVRGSPANEQYTIGTYIHHTKLCSSSEYVLFNFFLLWDVCTIFLRIIFVTPFFITSYELKSLIY